MGNYTLFKVSITFATEINSLNKMNATLQTTSTKWRLDSNQSDLVLRPSFIVDISGS
jgi:hypothetical protein